MSEINTNPYLDVFDDSEFGYQEDHKTTPNTLSRRLRRLVKEYTGNEQLFHSIEQEQILAARVQAGQRAAPELQQMQEFPPRGKRSNKWREQYQQLEEIIADAQRAEQELVAVNLRFAAFMARASMNIITPRDRTYNPETEELVDISERADEFRNGRRKIGGYGDITKLKSPYAVLDDRFQCGVIGLIEAARKFLPHTDTEKRKKPAAFISYAAYHIHNAIEKNMRYEVPGAVLSVSHQSSLRSFQKQRRLAELSDTDVDLSPEEIEKYERWENNQTTIPLEGLRYPGDDTDHAIDEILADPSQHIEEQLALRQRNLELNSVLERLSEREAGIMRLRYGLSDGQAHTLDEIGMVYDITRERVRQIESKTMSKLRHPELTRRLAGYLAIDSEISSSVYAGEEVLLPTGRYPAKGKIALSGTDQGTAPSVHIPPSLERWQASKDDAWDTPLRVRQDEWTEKSAVITEQFTQFLFQINPYTFQKSFAEQVHSDYPKALLDHINDRFGKNFTVAILEQFWNQSIDKFVLSLETKLGEELQYDRIGQLFSKLISEKMRDTYNLTLRIPERLNGKLSYLGARLTNGGLTIVGNAGDYTGYKMGQLGKITIKGNTGGHCAEGSSGYARVAVSGNTGHYLGAESYANSNISVEGKAGDYVGLNARGQTEIVVKGSVGNFFGVGLSSKEAVVEAHGNAGGKVGHKATAGQIFVGGMARSVDVDISMTGVVMVNDIIVHQKA